MRARDATTLTVAVACSALAACADASGIMLTVQPAEERPDSLAGAETLVVYVGYGDTEETPLDQATIHLHVDDGRARELELDAPFDAPIEVLLEGPQTGEPFYVAIRAIVDDEVVGEGGVDGTLTLVDGKVLTALAEVGGPLGRSMPNCPGFRSGDVRHYLVSAERDDDCDADGEPAAAPGPGLDCNDFDAAFSPEAQDEVCDDFDHSCGANTSITTSPCVVRNGDQCVAGSHVCEDGGGTSGECQADSAIPLPAAVCDACEDATNVDELEACLPDAVDYQATCTIERVEMKFCLTPSTAGHFTDNVWWYDTIGTSTPPTGGARWIDVPEVPPYTFEWVNESMNDTSDTATYYPGAPAIIMSETPSSTTEQFQKFAVMSDGNVTALLELWQVDFTVEDVAECPDPKEDVADCTGFPIPEMR